MISMYILRRYIRVYIIYNFTIIDYLWYFADYYLQLGENSWIVDCENENSSHHCVNNENKSHAMSVCENSVARFICQQIVFKLSTARHALYYIHFQREDCFH